MPSAVRPNLRAGPAGIRARLSEVCEALQAAEAAEEACAVISWQAGRLHAAEPSAISVSRQARAARGLLEASEALVLWQDARSRLERHLARATRATDGARASL